MDPRLRRHLYQAIGPPSFHSSSPSKVTAQLGASAFLPCKIKNLGNKSVSWFRKRDSHILTVDRTTFVADDRFSAWHEPGSHTWMLHIRYAQERDAGVYECQVSTVPKLSKFISLNILRPSSSIAGHQDKYALRGSTVTVQCVVSNAVHEPEYVFWYQDGLPVTQGGRHSITAGRPAAHTSAISLTISSVRTADAGNYTCAPAAVPIASATLHVLQNDKKAAMQTTGRSSGAARQAGRGSRWWLPGAALLLRWLT